MIAFAVVVAFGVVYNNARISLAELTTPARAAVEKLTVGGKIEKIDKEVEKGKRGRHGS